MHLYLDNIQIFIYASIYSRNDPDIVLFGLSPKDIVLFGLSLSGFSQGFKTRLLEEGFWASLKALKRVC